MMMQDFFFLQVCGGVLLFSAFIYAYLFEYQVSSGATEG